MSCTARKKDAHVLASRPARNVEWEAAARVHTLQNRSAHAHGVRMTGPAMRAMQPALVCPALVLCRCARLCCTPTSASRQASGQQPKTARCLTDTLAPGR